MAAVITNGHPRAQAEGKSVAIRLTGVFSSVLDFLEFDSFESSIVGSEIKIETGLLGRV